MFRSLKLLFLIKGIIKGDYRYSSGLMGEMHGLPQKLGQHFTLYGTGPDRFDRYFRDLCVSGKSENIAINEVINRLGITRLGTGRWGTTPESIELTAQASIGQVYRVRGHNLEVAVKVKYPKVEKKIRNDFAMTRKVLWPLRFLPLRNSGLLPVLTNLEQLLLEECDYRREALNQQAFHRLFAPDRDISAPDVIACNDGAIASQWVEGRNLSEDGEQPDEWFIATYFRFILMSLCRLGMVHSDPHPGNFIISGGPSGPRTLHVLDYGSVATFTTEEIGAVTRLLTGSYQGEEDLLPDLLLLGVRPESLEVYGPIAGDLVSVLLEPLYYPGEYDFRHWRLQYKINTLLASRAWERPFDIPLKLLLLFRALQGLYYYARKNSIIFNWNLCVRKYLY